MHREPQPLPPNATLHNMIPDPSAPQHPSATIPQRPRRSILALAAVTALAAGLLVWWTTRAPTVPAVSLRLAPLVRTLQFSARVATLSRVDVGGTLTGRVLQGAIRRRRSACEADIMTPAATPLIELSGIRKSYNLGLPNEA